MQPPIKVHTSSRAHNARTRGTLWVCCARGHSSKTQRRKQRSTPCGSPTIAILPDNKDSLALTRKKARLREVTQGCVQVYPAPLFCGVLVLPAPCQESNANAWRLGVWPIPANTAPQRAVRKKGVYSPPCTRRSCCEPHLPPCLRRASLVSAKGARTTSSFPFLPRLSARSASARPCRLVVSSTPPRMM